MSRRFRLLSQCESTDPKPKELGKSHFATIIKRAITLSHFVARYRLQKILLTCLGVAFVAIWQVLLIPIFENKVPEAYWIPASKTYENKRSWDTNETRVKRVFQNNTGTIQVKFPKDYIAKLREGQSRALYLAHVPGAFSIWIGDKLFATEPPPWTVVIPPPIEVNSLSTTADVTITFHFTGLGAGSEEFGSWEPKYELVLTTTKRAAIYQMLSAISSKVFIWSLLGLCILFGFQTLCKAWEETYFPRKKLHIPLELELEMMSLAVSTQEVTHFQVNAHEDGSINARGTALSSKGTFEVTAQRISDRVELGSWMKNGALFGRATNPKVWCSIPILIYGPDPTDSRRLYKALSEIHPDLDVRWAVSIPVAINELRNSSIGLLVYVQTGDIAAEEHGDTKYSLISLGLDRNLLGVTVVKNKLSNTGWGDVLIDDICDPDKSSEILARLWDTFCILNPKKTAA